jgi:phytanoyl-CoA hydroxylase
VLECARMTLSGPQLARYRDDGFLVVEDFVDPGACDALRARAAELVSSFDADAHRSVFTTDEQARRTDDYFLDSAEDIRFFFEEEAVGAGGALTVPKERAINKIGHALHDLDPEFERFSRAPRVAELVADLGVVEPRLVQSMYIFKQPHIGGEVRCHQDATFLQTDPCTVTGLWFALEDAHRDNGCLWAVPGGHRAGLASRFVREGRTTRMEAREAPTWDESKRVPLEVRKGALVVLDGRVPHMSEANRSAASRHAYSLHLVSAASAWLPTNWIERRTEARGF